MNPRLILSLSASVALLMSGAVQADDTDIFVTETAGGGNAAFQPNVLFVFDTSGSMDETIETFVPYDPDTDYGDSPDDEIYVYSTDLEDFITSVNTSQNNCQAMTSQIQANTDNPVWQGAAAFWDPEPQDAGGDGGDASFLDQFSRKRYDNNDGTSSWASNWVETGDDGDARNGDIQVQNRELRIREADNQIERTADLSGYSSGTLSFYYNMDIDPTGCFFIWCTYPDNQSVSLYINGTQVETFDRHDGEGTYTLDVTSYLSGTFSIQFVSSADFDRKSGQDSAPSFYVDNVAIATTGGAGAGDQAGGEPGSWENVCGGRNCDFEDDSIVECAADAGVHGAGGDSLNWAADGSGPYTGDSSDAFDWNGIVDDYKYVSGNYHDYLEDGTTERRKKIDIMKEEAKSLVDLFDGLNLGLMRFNQHSYDVGTQGGYVVHHFSDISDDTEKEALKTAIDALPASSNTPLTESMYEAMRYYRGENLVYGEAGKAAAPGAFTDDTYNSPIVNSCQKSHIVLLTDGEPTDDTSSNSTIRNLTNSDCSGHGGCLDELTGYLANNDQSSQTGTQEIKTYTIGFDIDLDLLSEAASKGKGKYFTAGNSKDLKDAFSQIIAEILDTGSTFTAPAVTVNAYNNLQHRNELYYAMFKPRATSRWAGNIKRYRIEGDGTVVDVTGADAINPETGFFSGTAKSWWSDARDGEKVEQGGVVDSLNSLRTVYVYTGTAAPSDVALNVDAHTMHPDNDALTNALMGLPDGTTNAKRLELINWARGFDVQNVRSDSDYHNFVADPLHTRPAVVTYGGTLAEPDDTVYAMTNLGYLAAIDTDNGQEVFSFMPKEVLPNLNKYFTDGAEINKTYGLDGHLTVWRQESTTDSDVTIEADEGDRVHLYFGMRRGGNHYYALDVTSRSSPKLMWQIDGGSGDFADLGQTWSKPVLANVNWSCENDGTGCTTKKVLIFGGGYDTVHDTTTTATTGDSGSAIFMVDALTGSLLWSAGNGVNHDLNLSDMQNSIPSSVTIGDLDGDSSIDVMFALDIMGHLWRFDIYGASTSASDFATGGMVADLSVTVSDDDGDGTVDNPEDLRRFYNSPDVAIFADRGHAPFFTASFGSGYRAKPKDEVIDDEFYVVFLESVFEAPTDDNGDVAYSAVTRADLLDATSEVANKNVNAPHGFLIDLPDDGEKAISDSLTFNGRVFFTSYLPDWSADTCGVDIGGSRIYGLNILTGEGLYPNGARSQDLNHAGIAPDPVIIFVNDPGVVPDGENPSSNTRGVLCVGTECDEPPGSEDLIKKTYWREQ